MPTNLYGPGDNFHPEHSHVLPAMIRRMREVAQLGQDSVTIWGSGIRRREVLHVDDMAEASLCLLDLPNDIYAANTAPLLSHINVGTGEDISILELGHLVAKVTGYGGANLNRPKQGRWNYAQAHGRKQAVAIGWSAGIGFRDSIAQTYRWYLDNAESARG